MNTTLTRDTLNDAMDFGSVIRVNLDGTVDVRPDLSIPVPEEMIVGALDADGECPSGFDAEVLGYLPTGWHPMRGRTGQYGASRENFVMHASESVGGAMAVDILATPGLYVAICVDGMLDDPDAETQPIGWMVARADLP